MQTNTPPIVSNGNMAILVRHDALEMQLILKNKSDDKEYIIDYPAEEKG
ncbi:hypothetical protein [Lacrimispora sp.]|nr:hypothetical protein [Lacrimispora sp.]